MNEANDEMTKYNVISFIRANHQWIAQQNPDRGNYVNLRISLVESMNILRLLATLVDLATGSVIDNPILLPYGYHYFGKSQDAINRCNRAMVETSLMGEELS
jgi:hypothetical protein